jgi:hypothetical protein
VIDAQTRQSVGEEVLDRGRAIVDPSPAAAGRAKRAELDGEQRLVAAIVERAANQELVVAHAVKITGVDQAYTLVERCVNGGDPLGLVARAVHAGHAHAAESEREDFGAGLAEFAEWNARILLRHVRWSLSTTRT